jgi:hypothetical protein
VIKNNVTNDLQVAWFTTIGEANAAMNQIEKSGVLGNDYWIQNTPRGAENVVKFKDETIVPGAVYLQDTMHPTVSSSSVRFYVCDNETGVNMVRTKILRIDYICEVYGMTRVSVYSVNPQNDMIQKADITAYLPGNLANKEPELIRHYVQIYIMAAAGPMADLVTDENKVFEEPHVHDHKEEGAGFRITPKKEEEKEEAPKQPEKKPAVEDDDDDDPFDYSDDSIESDQTVQLPEERY